MLSIHRTTIETLPLLFLSLQPSVVSTVCCCADCLRLTLIKYYSLLISVIEPLGSSLLKITTKHGFQLRT